MSDSQEYVALAEARIAQQARMLLTLRAALRPFAGIALLRDADASALDTIDAPCLAITPAQVRTARDAMDIT